MSDKFSSVVTGVAQGVEVGKAARPVGNLVTHPQGYTPSLLGTIPNQNADLDYAVKLYTREFTTLCPITGQPDFASLWIRYVPDKMLVESKSLKLYLMSFRNHGGFHENCIVIIVKDLYRLLEPRYVEAAGHFFPRGGISIDPYANQARPGTPWAEIATQRLLARDLCEQAASTEISF